MPVSWRVLRCVLVCMCVGMRQHKEGCASYNVATWCEMWVSVLTWVCLCKRGHARVKGGAQNLLWKIGENSIYFYHILKGFGQFLFRFPQAFPLFWRIASIGTGSLQERCIFFAFCVVVVLLVSRLWYLNTKVDRNYIQSKFWRFSSAGPRYIKGSMWVWMLM